MFIGKHRVNYFLFYSQMIKMHKL